MLQCVDALGFVVWWSAAGTRAVGPLCQQQPPLAPQELYVGAVGACSFTPEHPEHAGVCAQHNPELADVTRSTRMAAVFRLCFHTAPLQGSGV